MEVVSGLFIVIVVVFVVVKSQFFVMDRINNNDKSMFQKHQKIINFFKRVSPNLNVTKVSDHENLLIMSDGFSRVELLREFDGALKVNFRYYRKSFAVLEYHWEFVHQIYQDDIIEKFENDVLSFRKRLITPSIADAKRILSKIFIAFKHLDKMEGFQGINPRGIVYNFSSRNFPEFILYVAAKPDGYLIQWTLKDFHGKNHILTFNHECLEDTDKVIAETKLAIISYMDRVIKPLYSLQS